MVQIHGIKLKAPVKGDPGRLLLEKAAARLRVPANALEGPVILKESVDAREKPDVYKVYSLAFSSAKVSFLRTFPERYSERSVIPENGTSGIAFSGSRNTIPAVRRSR